MVYKTMVPWTIVENHGLYITMVPLTSQPRVVYKSMVPWTSVENHGLYIKTMVPWTSVENYGYEP